MKQILSKTYVCPADQNSLEIDPDGVDKDEILSGALIDAEGHRFAIRDGIPDFTYPETLSTVDEKTRSEYDAVAERIYDAAVDWQFKSMYEDEEQVRERMVDWLGLEPDSRVLEVGAGTGRDSFRLARRLDSRGELYLQDLAPNILSKCRENMVRYTSELDLACQQRFFISNAAYLPFPDRYFDAVFHFGGFNQFSEQKKSLEEFARVTKLGGKILVGDEAVAPWLRGTEFAGIVTTNNPLFAHETPLDKLPAGARDVSVHWIMANCFYVFEFVNGEGPPKIDLDLPHAGRRGGTMRSRYFGNLEGVSLEAKKMAAEAVAKRGTSMHAWLDEVVRAQAKKDLSGEDGDQ